MLNLDSLLSVFKLRATQKKKKKEKKKKKKGVCTTLQKLWAIFLYVKPIYNLLLALKICKRMWSIFFYVKLVYDLLLVLKISIIYEQSLTLSRFEEKKRFHPLCDYYNDYSRIFLVK